MTSDLTIKASVSSSASELAAPAYITWHNVNVRYSQFEQRPTTFKLSMVQLLMMLL